MRGARIDRPHPPALGGRRGLERRILRKADEHAAQMIPRRQRRYLGLHDGLVLGRETTACPLPGAGCCGSMTISAFAT